MTKNSVQFRHSLLLLLTAVIWGMAFVSQSKGMDYMKPLTFNAARCMIGAAVLFFYALIMGKVKGKNTKRRNCKKNRLEADTWRWHLLRSGTDGCQYFTAVRNQLHDGRKSRIFNNSLYYFCTRCKNPLRKKGSGTGLGRRADCGCRNVFSVRDGAIFHQHGGYFGFA